MEKIYRKYEVWDERQVHLKDYQPEAVTQRKAISTLREWPKYLPLLLRGALVTVWISVLAMMLAVAAGLVIVLVRLYGVGAGGHGRRRRMRGGDARDAPADPAFSYLLRFAADWNPAERGAGGDSGAGTQLRGERGGELPGGHPGGAEGGANGGVRSAGDEPVAMFAAYRAAAGLRLLILSVTQ